MMADRLTAATLARHIDHTLLKPEATREQIDRLCDECLEHNFAAACVNPYWVARCAHRLANSETDVASVVGFPLGVHATDVKVIEARLALDAGANELDMVVNLGALRSHDRDTVISDIAAVVTATKTTRSTALVKVIIETAALTPAEIQLACECCVAAEADYVKTSTGFHPAGGATEDAVRLLKQHGHPLKVKAAGGIRDLATARAMLAAGADRLGMSAGVSVLQELAD